MSGLCCGLRRACVCARVCRCECEFAGLSLLPSLPLLHTAPDPLYNIVILICNTICLKHPLKVYNFQVVQITLSALVRARVLYANCNNHHHNNNNGCLGATCAMRVVVVVVVVSPCVCVCFRV